MSIEDAAKKSYKIGRRQRVGRPELACVLRRSDDGGIKVSQSNLTDAERHQLYAHFGSAQRGRTGGLVKGAGYATWIDTVEAGTAEQFMRAIHAMPVPFMVMS